MKRPGVSAKKMTNPDQEPDLYAISQEHPVPELKRKNGNPPTTSGNSHWVIPATTTTTTSSSKSPVMVLDEEESKRVPAMVDISSVSTAVSSPSSTPSPTPTTMSPRRAPDLGSIDVILEELVSRHRASAAAATVPGRMSFAVSPTARNPMTFPSGLDDYSSRLALQLQFDQNARLAELVSRLNPPIPQLRAQSSTVLFAPRPQMDHTTSALAREYLRVLASQQQPSFRFI